MVEVIFDGVLQCGAYIQGAKVEVGEDYGMAELVRAIKAAGYISFMLPSMRRLAKVEA